MRSPVPRLAAVHHRSGFGCDLPSREGVLLETVLGSLGAPVAASSCEMME